MNKSQEPQARIDSSIGQAVRVLELVSSQHGHLCTLEHLASAMALPVPSVRRLVRSLIEHGLIMETGERAAYQCGPRSLRLSNLIQHSLPLEGIARPVMRGLVDKFDETVTLNAYVPRDGVSICIAVEECDKPIQYVLEPGEIKRLHSGASGKAIMAFLPAGAVDSVIERYGLIAVTPQTVTDRETLMRDFNAVRRNGVIVSYGERIPGAVGVAAPVFDAKGGVIASMAMTIPAVRCTQALVQAAKRAVREHAQTLSSILSAGVETKPSRRRSPVRQRRRS